MVVYNVDKNGTVSESSESGTGRNPSGSNGPVLVNDEAEDAISKFQSPINDELRQQEEEDNGDARTIMATDREEEVVGGELKNELRQLEFGISERTASEGEMQGSRLGLSVDFGLAGVMSLGYQMQQVEKIGHASVEDLDCDTRQWGIQSAGWAGMDSVHVQGFVLEASSEDVVACSIQNQDQNIN
ncbi:hypothetical protein Ancab_012311 [Ancistrocladus abbreviatus]